MLRVTFYADFVCPFCYCAERALLPRLARDHGVAFEWRPFELHPETPRSGRALRPKDAGRIWGGYRRLAASWELPIARKTPATVPNSRLVLRAAEAARSAGRLDDFREAVWRAFWVDGQDIGHPDVVQQLAAGLDLTDERWATAVAKTRSDALAECVTAVPAFVLDSKVIFGLQDEERFGRFLEAAPPTLS